MQKEIQDLENSNPNSDEKIKEKFEALAIFKLLEQRCIKITSLIKKIDDESSDLSQILREIDNQTQSLKSEIDLWWSNNKSTFVDWTIRFPFIAVAIALLNMAGATPLLATASALAAFGGPQLYNKVKEDVVKGIKSVKK